VSFRRERYAEILSPVLVGTDEIFADCDESAKREYVAELLRELIPYCLWISEAGKVGADRRARLRWWLELVASRNFRV
jgi:hypothetical protein